MKKIISYSLYGNNPRYTVNSIINAEIAKKIYSDWECRFYYDNSVPIKVIEKLKCYSNVNLIDMTNRPYHNFQTHHSSKMFWRFMAYDDNIDVVIFRDSDSYPSIRERDAVNQWLNENKSIHLMREVQPCHRSKIMGGMWGLRKNNKLKSIIEESAKLNRHPTDQNYLSNSVYPLFENDRVVHDSSNCFGDKTHDWPTERQHPEMYIGRTQGPPDSSLYPEEAKQYEQLIRETQ